MVTAHVPPLSLSLSLLTVVLTCPPRTARCGRHRHQTDVLGITEADLYGTLDLDTVLEVSPFFLFC